MKKLLFAIFIITTISSKAQVNKNFQLNPDVDKIVKMTYDLNFNGAFNLLEKHRSEDQSQFWKYVHAMVAFRKYLFLELHGKMTNSQEQKVADLFDTTLNEFYSIARSGDEQIRRNPQDTLALFYTGASYGYIGLCHALKDEIFKAASQGKKGLDYHDKLISLCPNWADVYLSQGIFNFYASDVPWYVKPVLWILGRSGTEENALKYFSKVIQNGQVARFEAFEMLIKLYIRKGDVSLARKKIDELINEVPSAKYYYLFLFALEFNRYERVEEYTQLLKYGISVSQGDQLSNISKETLGYIYIRTAMNYKMNNDFKNTINTLKEFVERKLIPEEESLCYLVMGDAYLALGDSKNGKECLKWVITNGKNKDYQRKAEEKLQKIDN